MSVASCAVALEMSKLSKPTSSLWDREALWRYTLAREEAGSLEEEEEEEEEEP